MKFSIIYFISKVRFCILFFMIVLQNLTEGYREKLHESKQLALVAYVAHAQANRVIKQTQDITHKMRFQVLYQL